MKACFFVAIPVFAALLFTFSCSGTGSSQQNVPTADSVIEKKVAEDFMFDCALLKKEALKTDSIILKQTETDLKLANRAIAAFTDFAYHCSSDSLAPIYLIKTAQVAQAINNTPQAKIVLEQCIKDYPNFNNRVAAIFLLAQLYDEAAYLNDEEQARVLYQKIIDEYPKSDWASSAKGAIRFIGKSDEQIMEELKKKK
ncbi:MAG TPA: tetratricopeptide repeat protein [Bacteroidia bacterium]|nr:tetratricopeptide repeat protein [Bacteroidia bacterium]